MPGRPQWSGDALTTPPVNLVISGGGEIAVATDELLGHAQLLESLRDEAHACRLRLAGVDGLVSDQQLRAAGAPPEAFLAARERERAAVELARLEREAAASARSLRTAAQHYGEREGALAVLTQRLGAIGGYGLGALLPALAWYLLPAAAVVAGGFAVGSHLVPGGQEEARRALTGWWRHHRGALGDPATVALLRTSVSSVDEAYSGLAGVPPLVHAILGEEGLAVLGVGSSAVGVAAFAARHGVFAETPVRVTAVSRSGDVAAPSGVADRVSRIPEPKANGSGAQIVVERYPVPGGPDRFEVYLGGTVDFSPIARDEVWDLTSNVHAMGELPAGSYRATQQALADAGVTRTSDVMFTGYSQGGLIASALAASGDYSPRGVLTVGAPAGQVPIPPEVPVIAIEHSDDLVPALGGVRTNGDAVVVERRAFGPEPVLSERAVPAHELGVYRETAALTDRARSELLGNAVQRFDAIGNGASGATDASGPSTGTSTTAGTATHYRAERIGREVD